MSSDFGATRSPTRVLGLEGWSKRSVFGWDDQLGTWWAQLWRDGSASFSPDVWIAHAGGDVSELVRMVSERAGVGFDVADWALAESLRPPSGRTWPLDLVEWTPRSTISWDPVDGWSARLWAGDSRSAYPDIEVGAVGDDRAGLVRAVAERVEIPIGLVADAVARSARSLLISEGD